MQELASCKGGLIMISEMRMAELEEENKRLREENRKLLLIIDQMKTTLNRLIDRCVGEERRNKD